MPAGGEARRKRATSLLLQRSVFFLSRVKVTSCRAEPGLVLASAFQWVKVLLVFSHPQSQLGPVDKVQNLFRPVSDMRIVFPIRALCLGGKIDGKVVPSIQNQKAIFFFAPVYFSKKKKLLLTQKQCVECLCVLKLFWKKVRTERRQDSGSTSGSTN